MNHRRIPIALFGAGAIGRTHLDRLQRSDRVVRAGIAAHWAVLEAAAKAPSPSDTLILPVNEGRKES